MNSALLCRLEYNLFHIKILQNPRVCHCQHQEFFWIFFETLKYQFQK
jgi:hypothetical protein